MNEVTAVSPRPTTSWVRTGGCEPRTYPLHALMDASGYGPLGLSDITELPIHVVERLDRNGLMQHQALTFAAACGLEALDVWPEWDESVLAFVERHEVGRCVCLVRVDG